MHVKHLANRVGEKGKLMKHSYLECSCTSVDHVMRLSYIPGEADYLYVEVHLRPRNFFSRFLGAIKYLFGYQSIYGDFDEFVWDAETVKQFKNYCEEWLKE